MAPLGKWTTPIFEATVFLVIGLVVNMIHGTGTAVSASGPGIGCSGVGRNDEAKRRKFAKLSSKLIENK